MDPNLYKNWLPPALSTHAAEVDYLINFIHVFMAILFVGWGLFMAYCLFRFRAAAGRKAVYQPVKALLSKYLEIGVVVVEAFLLLGLSIPAWAKIKTGFPPQDQIDRAVVVRVIAEQFKWLYHYPGLDGKFGRVDPKLIGSGDVASMIGLDPDDENGVDDIINYTLTIPIGQKVIARLTSKDVIHSFAINVLRVKQDVIPGMEIPVWFEAIGTGEFQVGCAQLCGLGHTTMQGKLEILGPEDYRRWRIKQHQVLGLELPPGYQDDQK